MTNNFRNKFYSSLLVNYRDENKFKSLFKEYDRDFKVHPIVKEYILFLDDIESSTMQDINEASEYVNDIVGYLKRNKKELLEGISFFEEKHLKNVKKGFFSDDIDALFDTVLATFNVKSAKKIKEAKRKLVDKLLVEKDTNDNIKLHDLKDVELSLLATALTKNFNKKYKGIFNEEEIKLFNALRSGDEIALKEVFDELLSENFVSIIDQLNNETLSVEESKSLGLTLKKLNEMKGSQPNNDMIIKLFALRNKIK